MAAPPYLRFYPTDYLIDTPHLTAEEHGAYLLLLFACWQHEGELPADDKRLSGICRMSVEQWLNVRSTVVEFFIEINGKLRNRRIDLELERVRGISEKAARAGRKSQWSQANENKKKLNNRSTSQSQSQSQIQSKDKTEVVDTVKNRAFSPPTIQEVITYAADNHFALDGESFVDFYACKNWMVGKNKMKDWKAAVRNWCRRQKEQGRNNGKTGNGMPYIPGLK